jgi:hypothetical protein
VEDRLPVRRGDEGQRGLDVARCRPVRGVVRRRGSERATLPGHQDPPDRRQGRAHGRGLGDEMVADVGQGTVDVDSLDALYAISALFGLVQSGIIPSYAVIVREYFPAREAASRLAAITVANFARPSWRRLRPENAAHGRASQRHGASSRRANSEAVLRISRCRSVRVNTPPPSRPSIREQGLGRKGRRYSRNCGKRRATRSGLEDRQRAHLDRFARGGVGRRFRQLEGAVRREAGAVPKAVPALDQQDLVALHLRRAVPALLGIVGEVVDLADPVRKDYASVTVGWVPPRS